MVGRIILDTLPSDLWLIIAKYNNGVEFIFHLNKYVGMEWFTYRHRGEFWYFMDGFIYYVIDQEDLVLLTWTSEVGSQSYIEIDAIYAVESNRLKSLEWMIRTFRSRWNDEANDICAAAAKCGNLDALRLLRGYDIPWDSRVCTYAADGNYPEILEWALSEGCEPATRFRSCAASLGIPLANIYDCRYLAAASSPDETIELFRHYLKVISDLDVPDHIWGIQ